MAFKVWTVVPVLSRHVRQSCLGTPKHMPPKLTPWPLHPGPCVGMDTACSSSLVAAHLGHRGLLAREASVAVCAGTNLMLLQSTTLGLAQLGALSATGRSKTFDASADGYGRGEACVVFVSRRHGGPAAPCAFMHASAFNQDGRSSGLTAPNGPAQTTVVRAALATAGAHPDTVGLVSVHGTGTQLGDPIEVNALGQALASSAHHPVAFGERSPAATSDCAVSQRVFWFLFC